MININIKITNYFMNKVENSKNKIYFINNIIRYVNYIHDNKKCYLTPKTNKLKIAFIYYYLYSIQSLYKQIKYNLQM